MSNSEQGMVAAIKRAIDGLKKWILIFMRAVRPSDKKADKGSASGSRL